MTALSNAVADGDLQFDRAVSAAPSVTCAKCSRVVTTYYFTVDDASYCASCKRTIEAEWAQRKTGLWRSAAYGFGAAVAGAAIYYAVIALTGLEIGIVALLIGYMVGYAVRSGAGRGGRRFQLLAAGLTYLSVGMAYSPLAVKPIITRNISSLLSKQHGVAKTSSKPAAPVAATADQNADSTAAPAPAPPARSAARARSRKMTWRVLVYALGALAALVVILPVIAIVGSLPAGLISALIIFIGMRRAWRMTGDTGGGAAPGATIIAGPFRVGGAGNTATAASA